MHLDAPINTTCEHKGGGGVVWARVSYQLLRLQDGLSLLSKDPHDAGTF